MLRAGRAARVLSVTELARMLRSALESGVGMVWVGGEISNLKRPPSGHLYFTLKDKQTQLAAVMFRSAAQVLVFQPTDGMGVVVRPVRVQGKGAGREIAAGIADLNRLADVDVVIVGRGGGSLEDLWAFNEEVVARAIAASTVPVVSAVGHEVDITIADFVADARAPTPTAAASLVVPDAAEVADGVARADAALRRALARRVSTARERLVALDRRRGGARLRPEPRAGARRGHGGLMADAAPRFEEALAELEGLVQRLEKGELPLEESLVAFERGVNLVRLLTQRLADVEQRVEVLLKTEAGKLIRRPLEDEEQ